MHFDEVSFVEKEYTAHWTCVIFCSTARIQAILAQSITASQASSDDSQQESLLMSMSQVPVSSSWVPPWLPSPPPPIYHFSPPQVGDYHDNTVTMASIAWCSSSSSSYIRSRIAQIFCLNFWFLLLVLLLAGCRVLFIPLLLFRNCMHLYLVFGFKFLSSLAFTDTALNLNLFLWKMCIYLLLVYGYFQKMVHFTCEKNQYDNLELWSCLPYIFYCEQCFKCCVDNVWFFKQKKFVAWTEAVVCIIRKNSLSAPFVRYITYMRIF